MDGSGVLAGLMVLSLAALTSAAVCPNSCVCTITPDGLHKATCSSLEDLYKFSLRQKHHNINILDLSHNNITKLTHELDRLTEVVTLDLSTNGFTEVGRFLQNAKKIVHLNLANNRIDELSLTVLPHRVSSLDLSNNLLRDVPSNLEHLRNLEHLEMEGNPLDCSCENIVSRDYLTNKGILIDHIRCASPDKYRGMSWLELKRKEVCRTGQNVADDLEIMNVGQVVDANAVEIGKEIKLLKAMPSQASTDLDEGQTWVVYGNSKDDDDEVLFLRAKRQVPKQNEYFEGSGAIDFTTDHPQSLSDNLSASQLKNEQLLLRVESSTPEPDGSGEGSGSGWSFIENYIDHTEDGQETETESTTTGEKELYINPVDTFLGRGASQEDTDIPKDILPNRPSVYGGSFSWFNSTTSTTTEKLITEKIQIQLENAVVMTEPATEDKPVHRTGTYVCIVIIVVLLIGLIGFAVVKGQMRKRRDRRLLRQQKRDIEKASKEMVDMNKSLLGKPATVSEPSEKKINGKYELVPTHDTPVKITENGLTNGKPMDNNQNRSSPPDNNKNREKILKPEVRPGGKLDLTPTTPPSPTETKKDSDSLSSEDIFIPINGDTPHMNGVTESDISQPLMNGDHNTDSDYLSPSREYVPVYSPDMGRVRIKMTETPKPKTPVLVTRSRSNAGDIIVTPSGNEGIPKSTT